MQPTHPLLEGPLRAALSRARPALLLDFDGTLSELVATPEEARLLPACGEAIARLLGLDVPLAIVSGRPIQDLEARCPFERAWLSGVHGAELAAPGGARMRGAPTPEVRRALDAFVRAARDLEPLGVRVEDKRLAVAAHVRGVEDPARRREALEALGRAAARLTAEGAPVSWFEGKAVVELRPREASKAGAVRALRRRWPAGAFLIALGDDTTDEEMFVETLRAEGTAIKVGPGPSAAPHRVEGPPQVASFLAALAHEVARRQVPPRESP